jgi:hypothetical protein
MCDEKGNFTEFYWIVICNRKCHLEGGNHCVNEFPNPGLTDI